MSAKKVSRRAWYWQRQGRRCYLVNSPQCERRSGKLPGGAPATWDHVFPRSRKSPGAVSLLLLACSGCNMRRGDKDPDPDHVDYALTLAREWFAYAGDGAHQLASIEAQVAAFRTRCAADEAAAQALIDYIESVSADPRAA